jgi:coproporphyrinogen III oxidase-like Fe-S oxidoreductase
VESAKMSQWANSGINRLSLGIQALNQADLKYLGRAHSVDEALHAIQLSKEYFPRSSFDLIYAR